jgi:poly(hydroxyalkanoate) depolymerase family esterase
VFLRRRGLWMIAAVCVAVAVAGVTGLIVAAGRGPAAGGLGRYLHGMVSERGAGYGYAVYLPPGLAAGRAVPLVVVLHGCGATADQIAAASQYDAVAARARFIVLYPDVSTLDVVHGRCWRGMWAPEAEGRGKGDAGAIAAMAGAVAGRWPADRRRVYVIGVSSGAFEAAALGVYYPDRFAAIGMLSGAAYIGGQLACVPAGAGPASTGTLARAALLQMGSRARVMPVIVMQGDADTTIAYRCAPQTISLWLSINDLILRRGRLPALPGSPADVRRGVVAGGHAYSVLSYAGASGCVIAQLWTIHRMGHFWSGGSAGRASALYSDPHGPSAATASWTFFTHWTLSGPRRPCQPPAR